MVRPLRAAKGAYGAADWSGNTTGVAAAAAVLNYGAVFAHSPHPAPAAAWGVNEWGAGPCGAGGFAALAGSMYAFAALRRGGGVASWGLVSNDTDCMMWSCATADVAPLLSDVTRAMDDDADGAGDAVAVAPVYYTFAAHTQGGRVVWWGGGVRGEVEGGVTAVVPVPTTAFAV
eukprot:gene43912-52623_t